MDFLGVGPLELFFILLIALIIFGPNDIVRAGKSLGKFLRKVVTSEGWRAFQQASKGMRDLPNTLMREAGIEEEELRNLTGVSDIEQATRGIENQISPWTTPPLNPSNIGGDQESHPVTDDSEKNEDEISPNPEDGQDDTPIPQKPSEPPPGSPFSQTIDNDN